MQPELHHAKSLARVISKAGKKVGQLAGQAMAMTSDLDPHDASLKVAVTSG